MNAEATVIGAGPAGLSAALGLARSGLKVRVYEQRPAWQERVCGAFMNSEALAHLDWLGVLNDLRERAAEVPNVVVTYGRDSGVMPIGTRGFGAMAIPRMEMERALVQLAEKENIEINFGSRAPQDCFGLTVFADGRFSGLVPRSFSGGGWYGWNASFDGARQKPGDMSLNFYPRGYVGTLTFADGRTNICGLVYRKASAAIAWEDVYAQALDQSPALKDRMDGSVRATEWRGVGPLPFARELRVSDGNSVRVGDAGAVGDPFMGEGNGRALGAGPLLWETLKRSSSPQSVPETYGSLWSEAYAARFRLGAWLRGALGHPRLFGIVAKILLGNPSLLRRATPHFHTGFLVKAEAKL